MSTFLPFIIIGLVSGSLYGLAATGLVLTYRTSGILNFAHGALAAIAVLVFYNLRIDHGWPWYWAGAVAVFVVGPIMGLILERMSAILARADAVIQIVATIGLILIVEASGHLWYGQEYIAFPAYLPQNTFRFADVNISYAQVIVFVIAITVTTALFLMLRFTRNGILMRAVVNSPELLDLSGVSPSTVRRLAWVIGATFAALSGVLLAPTVSLDVVVLIFLVVQAFGACAIGRFSSLPLTYLGGLIVGLIASIATKYIGTNAYLAGLPASVPFIVLFVVLLLTPRRHLARTRTVGQQVFDRWRAPWRFQAGLFIACIVFLAFVPDLFPVKLALWTSGLTYVITFLSLGLIVKGARLVSLAQLTFGAIGAAAFSHFTVGLGIPWFLALVLAGLVAVPVGALIALPASRLPGVFLALATLAMGIMFEQLLYARSWFFGVAEGGVKIHRPSGGPIDFTGDRNWYYLVLFIVALALVAVALLLRSRLGRLLTAMADSPIALRTHGADLVTVRVIAFCLSAFLAAIGGALFGANVGAVSPVSFATTSSLLVLALLIIQRGGVLFYPLIAGLAFQVFGVYLHLSDDWQTLLFGIFAVVAALTPNYENSQVPRSWRAAIDRVFDSKPTGEKTHAVSRTPRRSANGGLTLTDLTVAYGGAVAVSNLSLKAKPGQITALIGPNGAGKSTTFNVCSGLLQPREGRVELRGRDVSGLSADRRARMGLGRTFQRMELFDSMSVQDNIQLGVEAAMAGRNPLRNLISRPSDRGEIAAAVQDAIDLCDLESLRWSAAGSLSTGQRRIVELARVLAGDFSVLLLDEPSSGLDATESEAFGQILRRALDIRDLAVLMVEHDMSLVMGICDYIYVLDFGVKIFEGTPPEVARNPVVRAAYLGSEGSTELTQIEHDAPSVIGASD